MDYRLLSLPITTVLGVGMPGVVTPLVPYRLALQGVVCPAEAGGAVATMAVGALGWVWG